ncbi:Hypothetical protein PHPALM_3316 [Phytophthora palmivora]|uniref:Uncharacterized protein n=1 Tax=Phytophthora palmivora TaxID=4796 RepID=A0A2P4YMS2_9STRA|nr:Hypothetical protein PHPALM_3316 [Phytophthora palmivora]
MHSSLSTASNLPLQNFYSLLTAFSIFLQTKKSNKARAVDGFLSKSTALGYFSQIVILLRERYSNALSDSKRVAKIREKMASAIEERNLRANVQTNDAPGCTIKDLRVLVEYLVLQADQLSVAASGELFLHIARIKTAVVQGISIYKSPERWQQCMLHAFGVLFVCYDEPSEYLFPLVPRYAVSDLPGSQTYTQGEAVIYWESLQANTDNERKPAENPLMSSIRFTQRC